MFNGFVHIAVVALIVIATFDGRIAAIEQQPCWIWGPDQEITDSVHLEKIFQTESIASSVKLSVSDLYADLKISVDGKIVAASTPYSPIRTDDVEIRLNSGEHKIIVEAKGVTGPSAFFLRMDLTFEDGTRKSIVSDSSWQVSGAVEVKNLGPVEDRLLVPDSRRVGIDVVDNYEQWKQALSVEEGADPASFLIAPGFEIRLVRSALPTEDSWVSLAIDPQGRAIVAKEQKGLLRMTLSQGGEVVTKTELINTTLEECRGLAFIGNDLFANANNSNGLYRLRRDGNSLAEPELLFASSGGVGHGRNDLAVGPDGKLYSIHGDSVDLPKGAVDFTSLYREARRGSRTSEGHLLRIDPVSGGVEVLSAGLRNPFGIDFNNDGEIFTYDADAEYDMGSPWYRPTRVNHLVKGGDYGWRGVTNSWPPYYPDHPDNARTNLDIGKGSPTAVKFGTRSNFPDSYRKALFVLDWAYGRIIAVHMMPRGSSYLMVGETFLKGRPLNVTDLDFAIDGSMYFVTGGRKTQSALYRVRYVGSRVDQIPKATPHEIANQRFASRSRQLRYELEAALLEAPSKDRLDQAWKHLSNTDPWIQHAAANLVERHPTQMWMTRALSESEMTTAVLALTSLARSSQQELYPKVMRRLNEILPRIKSSTNKLSAFYAYWLCVKTHGNLDDGLRNAMEAVVGDEYPCRFDSISSYAHNRLLSEILVKIGSRNVVSKTIGLLKATPHQPEQMHFLYVLRNVQDGWTMDRRREYFSAIAQGNNYLGGAGMNDFLNRIRDEAVAALNDEERIQLKSLIEVASKVNEDVVETRPRALVKTWTVDELISPDANQKQPDAVRGAEIFTSASCIHCHRFGTRGTLIGPDLTAVSHRFNRRDLLTSIVDPSMVIAENYRSLRLVTTNGKSFVGQPRIGGDYRSPVLRLSTNPMKPLDVVEIPKAEIESQTWSNLSWMPKGLVDTFTKQEILDLLAYLESAP